MVILILENGKFTKVVQDKQEEVIGFDIIRQEFKSVPVLESLDYVRAIQDAYYGVKILASNFSASGEEEKMETLTASLKVTNNKVMTGKVEKKSLHPLWYALAGSMLLSFSLLLLSVLPLITK